MEKITIVLLSTALVAFAGSISTPPDSDSGIHNFATIEDLSNKVQDEEVETPRPFLLEPETTIEVVAPPPLKNAVRTPPVEGERHVVGSETCLCGRSIAKIVGGEDARINDLPWTALLYKRGFFGGRSPYCGGTLINSLYVLTAAHCVDGMSNRSIEVVLKEENLSSTVESKTYTFKVSKIIQHPKYSRRTIDSDIALLRLSSPVELSASGPFVPACVPKNNEQTYEGQNATVAGWGAVKQGGSVSKVLKRVDVPILSNQACNMTKYAGKITDNMLCAGDVEKGGKDSCQGDSGGPLVVDVYKRKMIVGVVSWGYGCAKPNSPGVYSRVANFADWIVSQTSDATYCNE
ncbi:mite allergen Der p 3 [Folsomia candida]|uniref:Mite allergen Der p 3 n=1 Tax=Folsomia candida TaxID=158441 RepID=A0A226DES5_FOLCA|nr:mite allergen Der p 3 [Folsomia candida]OXA43669.1 Mite allergen Der p 3 [Folsomia candida]